MESTYFVLEKIPDLTLSKYSSLDAAGIDGVLSHHNTFWRQMNRRGLLNEDSFHLFYEYDPERRQGDRLRTGIRFDTEDFIENNYLRETIQSSPLAAFYELRQGGSQRKKEDDSKGVYPMPDIHRHYGYSAHLIRKERQSKPLDPGLKESYYTVSEWEMNEKARLFNMSKLMAGIGKPCLYVLSAYPVDKAAELEESLSTALPKLRELTKSKIRLSLEGATSLGQKDENADIALHYYCDLLESLASNPHFICDIQVLSDDYMHASYILDAAASEALSEGDYEITYTGGYSFSDIGKNDIRYFAIDDAPEKLKYLPQLFILDEIVPFGILPALFSGETIETPKETLPDLNLRGLTLGVDTDHHVIEFPLENLSKHAFLAGVPGSGKTNSMMHLIHEMHVSYGIPVLILEPAKHEYRVMTTLADMNDLELFSPGAYTRFPLHINPFEFPKGMPLAEHIRNLLEVFTGTFQMDPPMPFLLDGAVEAVYKKHDWTYSMINRGQLTYPTMSELYTELEKKLEKTNYAEEIKGNLRSVLEVRIGSLITREMGNIYDVPRSTFPPEEWIKRSAIVELESLGKDPANYMTLLIATLVRETLKVENYDKKALNGKPRHVMFLEEAHNLIGKEAEPPAGANINPKISATAYIVKMLAEVRALGEGIVIADQLPTSMAPQIIKNTSLKIGLRITAMDDREFLGGTMSANPDQLEKMAVFTPGQALCSYEPLLKPFEIQIPYFKAKEGNLDDAVILQRIGANERYQNDLRASYDICSEAWEKKYKNMEKALNLVIGMGEKFARWRNGEESNKNELRDAAKSEAARIIKDVYKLQLEAYSFFSPWVAPFEVDNSFGHSSEAEDFRKVYLNDIENTLKKYDKLAESIKKEYAKYNQITEQQKMQDEAHLKKLKLLKEFLPLELDNWKRAAEAGAQDEMN